VLFTTDQVNAICKGDPEIAKHFHALLAIIDEQAKQIQSLTQRVHELERQLNQNSNNSSKPPSSDGFRKLPKSSRVPGGKKGAPKGHPGYNLPFTDSPDKIVMHTPETCSNCHRSLEGALSLGCERRQEFDLPPLRLESIEHRTEERCCAYCHAVTKAEFPAHVTAPTQYGTHVRALAIYMNQYQLIPLDRTHQFFVDHFGNGPSEGTILHYIQSCSQLLLQAEQTIRERLLQSTMLHSDETGVRVKGKQHWMHTVSSQLYTLLHIHESRGLKAITDNGLLPLYRGRLMHDSLSMYFHDKFHFDHSLCGAHLLRECQGIIENDGHLWAIDMKQFLQNAWKYMKSVRDGTEVPNPEKIVDLGRRYDEILEEGRKEWGPPKRSKMKKGAQKKTKAANLGERFLAYKSYILAFLYDPRIPFDNNLAERDLRMVKVKQKISGTIRTTKGAEAFARIRSVISSLRKQSRPVLESLALALRGEFVL
jgi:transposase